MKFQTKQEAFWAGKFGTEYIRRNRDDALLACNLDLFARALRSARDIKNVIEFGANIGMNLKALKLLYPSVDMHAIEINCEAAQQLGAVIPACNVFNISILEFVPCRDWDLS